MSFVALISPVVPLAFVPIPKLKKRTDDVVSIAWGIDSVIVPDEVIGLPDTVIFVPDIATDETLEFAVLKAPVAWAEAALAVSKAPLA